MDQKYQRVSRRNFLITGAALGVVSLARSTVLEKKSSTEECVFVTQDGNGGTDFCRWVNPLIGSNFARLSFFGAATRPEGMVNPCPDTSTNGYAYSSTEIRHFSVLHFFHVVGPAFMPTMGKVDPTLGWPGWKSSFNHQQEIVEVGYHKVHLDRYGIDTEITASERVSVFRFTAEQTGDCNILFGLKDAMCPDEASLEGGWIRKVHDDEIEGEVRVLNRIKNLDIRPIIDCKVFFVARFDTPIKQFSGWSGKHRHGEIKEISGPDAGGIVTLPVNAGKPVQMELAVSYCSLANARENMEHETSGRDFDIIRHETRDAWNKRLGKIEVRGGTAAAREKFYTDLFHSLLGRGKIDDVNGQYPDYATLSLVVRNLPPANNVAPRAVVTSSSEISSAPHAIDGIAGVLNRGQWLAAISDPSPWIQLTWSEPQYINRIDLFGPVDKPMQSLEKYLATGISGGPGCTLLFSDGSRVEAGYMDCNGSTKEVIFTPRHVKWVKLQLHAPAGERNLVGISEIRAYTTDSKPDFHVYNTDSFWWTQMNLNILWGILWPDVLLSYIKADLLWYENDWRHRLPHCILAGRRNWTMTGEQAVPLLATGIALDLPFDHQQALAAMVDVCTRPWPDYPLPECGWAGILDQWPVYMRLGYISYQADSFACTSKTLENSYTDWCIAQSAAKLGWNAESKTFFHRSQNWKNVFDRRLGYARPKNEDGSWVAPYDYLLSGNKTFCEANGAQYTWFPSHDVQGMCNVMGGNDRYCDKLNWHMRMGELVNFEDQYVSRRLVSYSNEPDFQVAHLFNYAGRPWLTQKWVQQVHFKAYSSIGTSPAAYCWNDEDEGQMGSLSVLMAMGIYSARGVVGNPPTYEITTPIFDRVTIHLDRKFYPGATFSVQTKRHGSADIYIRSARLNGQELENCWFPHMTLARGGTLELQLGRKPNRQWGSRRPPPSQSPQSEQPLPHYANLAQGRPVVADSSAIKYPPRYAVSGRGYRMWLSGTGNYPHWLAVDLETKRTIDLVEVRFAPDYPSAYDIEVSVDNRTWRKIVKVVDNEAVTPLRLHAIAPAMARYVRVLGVAGPRPAIGIISLRVYGA
jgi:putative alpha-1,2-mannosidase